MPNNSQRLSIPMPLGADANTRANRLAELTAIENNAGTLEQDNRPFFLRSVTYDSTNNRLSCTLGPGRLSFLGSVTVVATDTTFYINSPALNTTYYLFVAQGPVFSSSTSSSPGIGQILLWQVAVGTAFTSITITDFRGELIGSDAKSVSDTLTSHSANPDAHHPKLHAHNNTDGSGIVSTGLAVFQNNSGGTLNPGDVVIVDQVNSNAVTTTTAQDDPRIAGVVLTGGISLANITVAFTGTVAVVNTLAGVTKGQFLSASTTARLARGTPDQNAGTFGIALTNTTSGSVQALIKGGGGGTLTTQTTSLATQLTPTKVLQVPDGSLSVSGNTAILSFGSNLVQSQVFTAQTGAIVGPLSSIPNKILIVTKNGIEQDPGTHYNISGSNLTFTTALSNDNVYVLWITANSFQAATTPYTESFTPSYGATAISVTNPVGSVLGVYRNALFQPATDAQGNVIWTNGGTNNQTFTFTTSFTGSERLTIVYAQMMGAGNATSVNNILAFPASTPTANALVALDSSALLPPSVLPAPLTIVSGVLQINTGGLKVNGTVDFTGTTSIKGIPPQLNLLVNGGFEVWQRGNGPFGSGLHGPDRWVSATGTGAALTQSKDTTHQDVDSTACNAIAYTAGTTSSIIDQAIETNGPGLKGKPITFSARVAPAAVGGVRLRVVDVDGATVLGSSAPNVGGSNLVYETLSITVTPTATNAGGKLTVRFEFLTGAVSGTYYLDNAMLVVSPIPVDYVPLTPADDLARCLRYYQRWTQSALNQSLDVTIGQCTSTTQAILVAIPVGRLGGAPTLTFSALSDWGILAANGAAIACTSIAINGAFNDGRLGIITNVASGLVAGNATRFINIANANAWMAFEWNP